MDGLDRAPGAFLDLMRGGNTGKMLARLAGHRGRRYPKSTARRVKSLTFVHS